MPKKATLLIAEDDVNIQDLLCAIFQQYFTLIQVSDGEAAIEKVNSQRIDLAILDINIPKKNGLQVLNAIQQLPVNSRPGTVILSGDSSASSVSRAYDGGADLFVAKPFDLLPFHRDVMNLLLKVTEQPDEVNALA